MDIHLSSARPSAEEKEAIDAVVGAPSSRWDGGDRSRPVDDHLAEGGAAARERRHMLLPALHAANDRVGWISEGALNYICERLTIPPAEAYGVASFYHMFSLKPRPRRIVYVCDDIACMCSGSDELQSQLRRDLAPEGESFDGDVAWLPSPCLGLCDKAPAAVSSRAVISHATSAAIHESSLPGIQDSGYTELRSSAWVSSLPQYQRDSYKTDKARTKAEYSSLLKAIEIGPDRVIEEVKLSKLMGRGGAAFPTGRKWEAVAREPARPHYIVCNADESEPGTFKDLALMTRSPWGIVEAMTIAAFAGRCERGFLYIRGEYPDALNAMDHAIRRARNSGALGSDIFGSGFDFDIEIRSGAGAYICGEETALFNSIEGYRGEPRNKPPFPVQHGLFGKPTIVNNVETLINVPGIVFYGGAEYAKTGTSESTGTKLFCLSGCVEKPGVYEIPFGTTLRTLIKMAGGVRGGRPLQAVLLGGAAGTFLTPDEIDVPLSFEGVRAIKATLGSGVVMLFDDTVDLRKIVARIARFFREESCGQCVPCRVGTVRQEELLERLASGESNGKTNGERALLGEIGQAMRDASICGLGQTASSAVESALAKFDLFGTKAG